MERGRKTSPWIRPGLFLSKAVTREKQNDIEISRENAQLRSSKKKAKTTFHLYKLKRRNATCR